MVIYNVAEFTTAYKASFGNVAAFERCPKLTLASQAAIKRVDLYWKN
jgi:hypothetical protein